MDGGKLTNQRGFLVSCLKIVDTLACCRMLGIDIEDIAPGMSVVAGMQPPRFMLMIGMLVGQDTLKNNKILASRRHFFNP